MNKKDLSIAVKQYIKDIRNRCLYAKKRIVLY